MTDPAGSSSDRWIQPDGHPSDDYFTAVTAAIVDRGIAVASTRHPYSSAFELELAPAAYDHRAHRGSTEVTIRWTCDCAADYHRGDFSGQGWHWARFNDRGRIHMRRFKELHHLSDPADVGGRSCPTAVPSSVRAGGLFRFG